MPLIASAAVTVALTIVAVAAIKHLRVAIAAIVAVLFVVAPFGVECLAAILLRERHALWLDLRLPLLALPGVVAVLAAWATQRRRPFAGSAKAVAIWTWCALWGAANTVNACAPGWCGRYGFPFPFYSWSDVIVIFNGVGPQPFHATLLVLDVVVLAVGAYAFARAVR